MMHVDGVPLGPHDKPEVIDDWALHRVSGLHSTKLFVGACWRGNDMKPDISASDVTAKLLSVAGEEQRLTQFFRGELAGVSVLSGRVESEHAIKCVTNCAERLDFHAMSDLEQGMTLAFNSEMSQITIEGRQLASVERLVRKIGYENSHMHPNAADRYVQMTTDIKSVCCKSCSCMSHTLYVIGELWSISSCTDKRQLQVPAVMISIDLQQPLPSEATDEDSVEADDVSDDEDDVSDDEDDVSDYEDDVSDELEEDYDIEEEYDDAASDERLLPSVFVDGTAVRTPYEDKVASGVAVFEDVLVTLVSLASDEADSQVRVQVLRCSGSALKRA